MASNSYEEKKEIRRKIPAAKRYIIFLKLLRGEGFGPRRATQDSRGPALKNGFRLEPPPINSFSEKGYSPFTALGNAKADFQFTKLNVNGIYPKQGFCDKNMSLGGSESGERMSQTVQERRCAQSVPRRTRDAAVKST